MSRKRRQSSPIVKNPAITEPAEVVPAKEKESRLGFAGAVIALAVGLSTLVNTAYDNFIGTPQRAREQKVQFDAWLESVGMTDGSAGFLARQAESAEKTTEMVAKLTAADEKDSLKQKVFGEFRLAFHYLRLNHVNPEVRRMLQDAYDQIEAFGVFPNSEASKIIAVIQDTYPEVVANCHGAISPALSSESRFVFAEDFGSLMASHECYINWTSPLSQLTKQVFDSCSRRRTEEYANLEKELIQLCNGRNAFAEKLLTDPKFRGQIPEKIKQIVAKLDGGVDIVELDAVNFLALVEQDIARWRTERGIVLQF